MLSINTVQVGSSKKMAEFNKLQELLLSKCMTELCSNVLISTASCGSALNQIIALEFPQYAPWHYFLMLMGSSKTQLGHLFLKYIKLFVCVKLSLSQIFS